MRGIFNDTKSTLTLSLYNACCTIIALDAPDVVTVGDTDTLLPPVAVPVIDRLKSIGLTVAVLLEAPSPTAVIADTR